MELTLRELKGMLKINKHKLDDELEVQAHVHFQISEKLSGAIGRQQRLESEMEEYDAKLLLSMRKSDVKRTVAELQAEILTSGDHQSWLDDLHIARHEVAEWQGMYEAWKQRGFALKSLADLAMSNYYNVDTTYQRPVVQRSEVRRRT